MRQCHFREGGHKRIPARIYEYCKFWPRVFTPFDARVLRFHPKRKLEVLPKLVFHDKFLWANSSESAVQAVRDMLSKRSR